MGVLDDVLALVRRRVVVYQREAQVLLEKPPDVEHWDVVNALTRLQVEGAISSQDFGREKWFFESSNTWSDVEKIVWEKAELVKIYSEYDYSFKSVPEGTRYDDYSEYLLEDAFKRCGCVLFGKSASYFGGREYRPAGEQAGRPPDLGFTVGAQGCNLLMGVQVKNRLGYPAAEDIEQLIDICSVLGLRPVMVARMLSGVEVKRILGVGGYAMFYKRWLLKPGMKTGVFNKISDAGKRSSVLGLPVSIYRWTPDFLARKVKEAVASLSSRC